MSVLASTSSAVTRRDGPARRTVPVTRCVTPSSRARVGVSKVLPLSAIAELREMTRSAETRARSEITSSVRPSLKYSLSGSGLRLTKGRTTIVGAPRGRERCGRPFPARRRERGGERGHAREAWADPARGLRQSALDRGRDLGPPRADRRRCLARLLREHLQDVPPTNGGSPASISNSMQARL